MFYKVANWANYLLILETESGNINSNKISFYSFYQWQHLLIRTSLLVSFKKYHIFMKENDIYSRITICSPETQLISVIRLSPSTSGKLTLHKVSANTYIFPQLKIQDNIGTRIPTPSQPAQPNTFISNISQSQNETKL